MFNKEEVSFIKNCVLDKIEYFKRALEDNYNMDFWVESDVEDVNRTINSLKTINQKLNKLEEEL